MILLVPPPRLICLALRFRGSTLLPARPLLTTEKRSSHLGDRFPLVGHLRHVGGRVVEVRLRELPSLFLARSATCRERRGRGGRFTAPVSSKPRRLRQPPYQTCKRGLPRGFIECVASKSCVSPRPSSSSRRRLTDALYALLVGLDGGLAEAVVRAARPVSGMLRTRKAGVKVRKMDGGLIALAVQQFER